MSTLLSWVQDLWREAGAAGVLPATTANATGETRRFVNWIIRADIKIQNLWQDWKYLRNETTIATVAAQSTITTPLVPTVAAAGLALWDYETFYIIYPNSGGVQVPITTVEYEKVRNQTLDPNGTGAPNRVVIMPDNTLRLDPPIPDQVYTIGADYFMQPVRMANDTDTSLIPAQFHEVVLGLALMFYGNFENAADAKSQGQELYDDYLARLENSQLPNGKNSRYKSGGFFEVIAE